MRFVLGGGYRLVSHLLPSWQVGKSDKMGKKLRRNSYGPRQLVVK
jgi:hypothetical protein